MSNSDLTKQELYEGVKTILEHNESHLHLTQQKLYTLFSIAFNYFLYESQQNPGHYIIRVENSYLIEKLARKAKDITTRKFMDKLNLPRRFKYENSMFHLDFFNFTTWAKTNELPKEKVKGALIVKNANKGPVAHDFIEDESVTEILKTLPDDYYYQSLREFVPKTVIIAFEETYEDTIPLKFGFIKDEDSFKLSKGVSIASDLNLDDLED